jgi:hypothetical protein
MIKYIPAKEYQKLWESLKDVRRIEFFERFPGESNESYTSRLHKHLNPDRPRTIDMWEHSGLVTYIPIKPVLIP